MCPSTPTAHGWSTRWATATWYAACAFLAAAPREPAAARHPPWHKPPDALMVFTRHSLLHTHSATSCRCSGSEPSAHTSTPCASTR
eukprot:2560895-Prymnesium_polylepis.1